MPEATAHFDREALHTLLTTDDNADTYRRVLENAIEYQREHVDGERWEKYDHTGFGASDIGAAGWELPQLAQTGVFTKCYGGGSAYYRMGEFHKNEDGDKVWDEYWHEEAAQVLEAAKQQDRSPNGEEAVPVGEQADLSEMDVDELFTDVVGYEKEKKWFRRTLAKQKQVHHLLIGQEGTGKTMILDDLVENVPGARRVVFTGDQTTAQGVNDILREEQPTVLVVEEIEKGSRSDREALMTLCGQGYIQETKGDDRKGDVIDLDTIVFAAGNDLDRISPDSLVDRFLVWPFEQYTREEFIEVCEGVLPRDEDVSDEMARHIAETMFAQHGSTSVRDARDIAGLAETPEEVEELAQLVLG